MSELYSPYQPFEVEDIAKFIERDHGLSAYVLNRREQWRKEYEFSIEAMLSWADEASFCRKCLADHTACGDGLVVGLELSDLRFKQIVRPDLSYACWDFFGSFSSEWNNGLFRQEVAAHGRASIKKWPGAINMSQRLFQSTGEQCDFAMLDFVNGVGFGMFIGESAVLRIGYEDPDDYRQDWARDIEDRAYEEKYGHTRESKIW